MKIGIDYGGVISMSPDEWTTAIGDAKKNGYEFYLISHAQSYEEVERQVFADRVGMTNLTFSDLTSGVQELEIAQRKAELCHQYGIQIFIDDDINRIEMVARTCNCSTLYVPQNLWQVGLMFICSMSHK